MKQQTVLVIDNHPALQDMYKAIFNDKQFTVVIAETKEEGLEKLKQATWDIVVVDVLFEGGINGMDLMETYYRDPVSQTLSPTENPF